MSRTYGDAADILDLEAEMFKYAGYTGASVLNVDAWRIFKLDNADLCKNVTAEELHAKFWTEMMPHKELYFTYYGDRVVRMLVDYLPPLTAALPGINPNANDYPNVQLKKFPQASTDKAEREEKCRFESYRPEKQCAINEIKNKMDPAPRSPFPDLERSEVPSDNEHDRSFLEVP